LQASAVIGDPPNFYKFSGQFQIVGRLYGEVDFGIIKVGVSLEIYVRAGITFEAYADLLLYLEAGVRVKASVTIAFVEINFSFSATIRAEFLVKAPFGPPEDAPWYSELESTSTSARALAQVDELLPVPWVDKPINPTPVDINVY